MVCLSGVAVRPMRIGVEVFEHLAPEVVDGAVAFVGDDDVEGLDGDGRVVFDGLARSLKTFSKPGRIPLRLLRSRSFAFQHGIEALDGGDADPAPWVERVGGQALDVVLLGEFAVVVGRDVLLELLEGLLPEVAPVDQKEHAPGAGELDQAVAQDDGE